MPRAAENSRRLTRELVKRVKPQEKRFAIHDTDVPDLSLRVYPSGARSYVVRVTFTDPMGKTRQAFHTIGDATGFTDSEDARKAALALRQRYKAGEDVQETTRAARAVAAVVGKTLSECLDAYLYPELALAPWPSARWKTQREWSPPRRRTRRLTKETACAWMAATEAWPHQRDRALFLTLFFTGLRISEAMTLLWSDVDLDRGRIILRDTKVRETVTLPLAGQAVAALSVLPMDTEWVFPSVNRAGEVGPMDYPGKAINRHEAESGVEWSPHDLRRGFISVGTAIGVPDPAVRRLTNHKIDQRDAHDGYIGFEPNELAPHVQRIANALENMARATRGAVVELHPQASIA